jgi:hypothetical protein
MTVLRFPLPFTLSGRLFESTRLRRCRLEECRAACCLHGVWVDPLEKEDILRHAKAIIPFLPGGRRDPKDWFGEEREADDLLPSGYAVASAVVPNPAHYGGTECVFLRPDGLCSLQAAAGAGGEHPWRWKPFHCIIHPITTEDGAFTIASDEELLAEEGSCFRAGGRESRMSDWLAEEIEFLTANPGGQPRKIISGD